MSMVKILTSLIRETPLGEMFSQDITGADVKELAEGIERQSRAYLSDALIRAALEAALKNLRMYAPHEEYNTGPEHDIGYAAGYHTALNRVRALANDPEALARIKERANE